MSSYRAALERLERRVAGLRRPAVRVVTTPPLDQWAAKYLSGYFTCAPSKFHAWLKVELNRLHNTRGQRLCVQAPRAAAKSTWSSLAYPLWCVLHGIEPYIIITSDTTGQAQMFLDAIRSELETNPLLRRDYPHLTGGGRVWRNDKIELNNGCAIEALGTGAKIRGRKNRQHRPSLILVDDPQNLEHILSPVQRERSWEWLQKDAQNAGDPDTNLLVLGTALHQACIVCRLQKTPGWRTQVFRAVIRWPDRMDLWGEWERALNDWGKEIEERERLAREFYEANRGEMDRGAEVLWPEREPLYKLMLLKATVGSAAFGSEKQNDPINPDLCEWPPDYFDHPGLWFDEWPELILKAEALDPSKSKDSKHGDYAAFVRLGMDRKGQLYCEADLRRCTAEMVVQLGVEEARQFRPEGLAVEVNQLQELFANEVVAEAKRQGVDLNLWEVHNLVHKEVRIRRLGPLLEQKRIRFKSRSPGTALLVQQLQLFPFGDHDDGPDALEMAYRLLLELMRGGKAKQGVRRLQA